MGPRHAGGACRRCSSRVLAVGEMFAISGGCVGRGEPDVGALPAAVVRGVGCRTHAGAKANTSVRSFGAAWRMSAVCRRRRRCCPLRSLVRRPLFFLDARAGSCENLDSITHTLLVSDDSLVLRWMPVRPPLSGSFSNSVTIPFFPLQILVLAALKIFRDAYRPKRARGAILGCAARDIGIQRDDETSAALQTESNATVGSLTLVSSARHRSLRTATGNVFLAAAVTYARYRRETRARMHAHTLTGPK